jgi:hypothetical protein
MVANQEDDEKLREVKAVLQSLSQIGSDRFPAAGGPSEFGQNATTLESLTNRRNMSQTPGQPARPGPGSKEIANARPARQKNRLGAFALATIAGGTVLVLATDMFFKYWPASQTGRPTAAVSAVNSTQPLPAVAPRAVASGSASPAGAAQPVVHPPVAAAAVPPSPPSPAIASAKQLMDTGKIVAARGLLQQPTLASSRDAAWLLARSYDPNYLATIKSPDASGDKEKATEWYRRWRDIGALNGVPMDDVRLKRLIETLD